MGEERITRSPWSRLLAATAGVAFVLWLAAAPGALAADTTPPHVTIIDGPASLTRDASPSFAFSADEPAEFWCRVQSADHAIDRLGPCPPMVTLSPLPDGEMTFEVYGIDDAGNSGWMDPASLTFVIDHTKPEVRFAAKPERVTLARRATFRLRADEPVDMRCRLDGEGAWRQCNDSVTFRRLAPGRHAIRVHARDPADNVGRRTWAWRVVKP